MQISELKPFQKRVDLSFKVVEVREAKEVQSKLDNTTHKVAEAVVADSSGSILLTLWDDAITKVAQGKSYKLGNGFTSLFQNTLRLNIGRQGTIEETEDIGEVNKENDVSSKEFERGPRRFGGGGGRGGFGGGGRGGFGGGGRGGFRGGGGGGFSRERQAPKEESTEEESFEEPSEE